MLIDKANQACNSPRSDLRGSWWEGAPFLEGSWLFHTAIPTLVWSPSQGLSAACSISGMAAFSGSLHQNTYVQVNANTDYNLKRTKQNKSNGT
jgi:hypothetical protein